MNIEYGRDPLTIKICGKVIDFDINTVVDIKYIKNTFNDLISKLSSDHRGEINYWQLKIVERNTVASDLFLETCYLAYITNLIMNHEDELTIVTNRGAVYNYLIDKYSCNRSLWTRMAFKLQQYRYILLQYLKIVDFLIKWTYRHVFTKLVSVVFNNNVDIKNNCIIVTWSGNENFRNEGFVDSYFGNLASYLGKNKINTLTLPILYRGTRLSKSILFMKRNPNQFMLLETYLSYIDYFVAVWHFLRKRFFKFENLLINLTKPESSVTIDIAGLFRYHMHYESIEIGSLLYLLCKRLKLSGVDKLTVIQPFENMIPEKCFVLGAMKWMRESKFIGYYHTCKPDNQLCFDYASDEEALIAPKPNSVIFNSNQYMQCYQSLSKNIKLKNGFAFKQSYLSNKNSFIPINGIVLILFSGSDSDIKAMLSFLEENISLIPKKYACIKQHPLCRFKLPRFMRDIEVSNHSLDKIFPRVNKVLSTYSTALLEAALQGRYTGIIYNKKSLFLNPFDNTGVHNYKIIKDKIDLYDFLNQQYSGAIANADTLFNLSEEGYKAFIEEI